MRFLVLACLLSFAAGCAMFQDDTLDEVLVEGSKARKSEAEVSKLLKQHYELGERYYQEGKLALAASEYRAMLDLRPQDENALYRLGNIAFKEGNADKSAQFFEKVIEANPRNAKAHYNLASIRLMQSQNHFKYYAALAGKGVDLSKVSTLLGNIDEFTSLPSVSEDQTSLDRISGALRSR